MQAEAVLALVLMTAAIMLPIVPSWFLFRTMRSNGEMSGPLGGFKVRLSGAVVGYFVLFYFMLGAIPESSGHYHTWTVSGRLAFERPDGTPAPNVNDVFVRFVPPRLSVLNEGAFSWEIPVVEDRSGRLQFPDLQVDLPGYYGLTIPLRRDRKYGGPALKTTYDDSARHIEIETPLTLRAR